MTPQKNTIKYQRYFLMFMNTCEKEETNFEATLDEEKPWHM
jgi:hypothetical protein